MSRRHIANPRRCFRRARALLEAVEPRTLLAASIYGSVYEELDGDGVKDSFEGGVGGVVMFDDANDNGLFDVGEVTAASGSSGDFHFGNVSPGAHRIGVVARDGWTSPPTRLIDAPASGITTGHAFLVTPAMLGDRMTTIGDVFRVDLGGVAASSSAAATNEAGASIIVWTAGTDVYAKVLLADGIGEVAAFKASDTATATVGSAFALADGSFLVSFFADGATRLRRVAANGTPAGPSVVRVALPAGATLARTAADGEGRLVVAYELTDGDGRGVWAQRFSADGAADGPAIAVNETTAGNQSDPGVTVNGDGDFVVAWSSLGDGDASGIYARRFAADGTPHGGEFRASLTTAGAQTAGRPVMNDSGAFAVFYTTPNIDGAIGSKGVYRRFDASGAPIDRGEIPASIPTAGVAASMQSDGGVSVAWSSSNTFSLSHFSPIDAPAGGFSYTDPTSGLSGGALALNSRGDGVVTWTRGTNPTTIYARRVRTGPAAVYFVPKLTASESVFEARFSDPVAQSLTESDLRVENVSTGQVLSSDLIDFDYDADTARARFAVSGGVLPNGHYRVSIAAGDVTSDLTGRTLNAAATLEFFWYRTADAGESVRLKPNSTRTQVEVFAGDSPAAFTVPYSSSIPFYVGGGVGDDRLELDISASLTIGFAVTFDGGGGTGDTFAFTGGSFGDTVDLYADRFTYGATPFIPTASLASVECFAFAGNGSSDSLRVRGWTGAVMMIGRDTAQVFSGSIIFDGGYEALPDNAPGLVIHAGATARFTSPQVLWSLSVSNGGRVEAAPGLDRPIYLDAMGFGAGSVFDLADNDLIVAYFSTSLIGTSNGSTYSGVTGLIASGVIRSSAALDGYTTLGIAEARDVLGLNSGESGVWGGRTVDATSLLIKYTYAGDANLDGIVSGDDYAAIDSNVTVPSASGWYNGDFNYDGIISGDDYAFIDSNIVAQGDPL